MLNAIVDSQSDFASSDNDEDAEDEAEDEDTEQSNLSEDDEPGWVIGTISKTVHRRMERWLQMKKLDEITQRGSGDVADNLHEQDTLYWMSELKVPRVMKSETEHVAAATPPTTLGALVGTLDIVTGISWMPQCPSQPESRHMRVGSGTPKSPEHTSSLPPGADSDLSQIMYATQVQPVSTYQCILPPELITI